MKIGICFGGYCPLHRGHLDVIMRAKKENDKVFVVVCGYNDEPRSKEIGLDHDKRYKLIKNHFMKDEIIEVIKVNDDDLGIDQSCSLDNWKIWTDCVMEMVMAFYGDDVKFYVAESSYAEALIKLDYDVALMSKRTPVSGTMIRSNPTKYFSYITKEFQPYFVKNILVIGTASEGKTTLVKDIADYFNIPYTVEFGRKYMEISDMRDEELEYLEFSRFLSGQYNEYEIAVNKAATGITIQDTDNLVTCMYAKAYSTDPHMKVSIDDYKYINIGAKNYAPLFKWDHIFILTPGNENFVDDGSRYMGQSSMEERKKNMAILEELIDEFGYDRNKITYLDGGDYKNNFYTVKEYIENLTK